MKQETERVITTATPNLPIRENLEGKSKRVTPEIDRSKRPVKKPGGHDSPQDGHPQDRNLYADPANYRYPVDTEDRVRTAWSYINIPENQEEYDAAELAYVKARIRAAAKRFGVKIQAQTERLQRSMEFSMRQEDRFAPFQFFVPIARVSEEDRIVEGYAYCNAEVGDGWNLKREALEAAASDYMRWGAIRVMHQPVAAGTAKAVDFDDRGAFLRAKIVDDNEWLKVKEGVYKGFSVGGKPKIVRGKDIEVFDWVETSLVDRPADPDAVFTLVRMEGTDANNTEVNMTVPEELERGTFPPKKSDEEEEKKKPFPPKAKDDTDGQDDKTTDDATKDDESGADNDKQETDVTAAADDGEKAQTDQDVAQDDSPDPDQPQAAQGDDAQVPQGDDAQAPQGDDNGGDQPDPGQGDVKQDGAAETLADKLGDATSEGIHDFSTQLTNTSTDQVLNDALENLWMLHEVLGKIAHSGMSEQDKEVKARTSIQQFADHIVPKLRGMGSNVTTDQPTDEQVKPTEDPSVTHEEEQAPEVGKQDDTTRAETSEVPAETAEVERSDEPATDLPTEDVTRSDATESDKTEEVTRVDEATAVIDELPELQRIKADNEELIQRVASVESELARVQGLLTSAEERAKKAEAKLDETPAPGAAVVRFPQALERSFTANGGRQVPQEVVDLQDKLERLQRELPSEIDEKKRIDGVMEMQRLKMDLARFGVTSFSR